MQYILNYSTYHALVTTEFGKISTLRKIIFLEFTSKAKQQSEIPITLDYVHQLMYN